LRIAIQGELGSNSHMAALAMLGDAAVEIIACAASPEVFERVVAGSVDAAVLPIENSLHGSVAEHYDLLLAQPVRIARESLLRVRHNLVVRPGVTLGEVRKALSHPVALSQCRRWLAAHPEIEAVNFYDTAGSVKYILAAGLGDAGGIAPELAARQYGGEVLAAGIEDHAENFTRFFLLVRDGRDAGAFGGLSGPPPGERLAEAGYPGGTANKASLAFSVEHRPGTLVAALEELARAGVNLTKIESRPVPGMPWEYVFFVDLRFDSPGQIDLALSSLARHCRMVKELGRYVAA
jgi:prephenate dehydratase